MPDRSLRFVLSRRWLFFALAVAASVYACWWLGGWQFGRLTDRKAENVVVRANEDRAPAPATDVLAPGRPVAETDEWRRVTATGTYATDQTVVVRYRSRDAGSGIDLVVPLVAEDGTALLVDRGWLRADPQGTDLSDVPDPPAGVVTVTGWVREDGTGSSTRVDRVDGGLSTRAIDSTAIGAASGLTVLGGFVELDTETPAPTTALTAVELPELDNGPHFFYGLQWWFFGVLAVFGFFYLMYDEWRFGPRGERPTRRRTPQRAVDRPAKPPSKAQVRRELVAREEAKRAEARREREQV